MGKALLVKLWEALISVLPVTGIVLAVSKVMPGISGSCFDMR